jgi:hypothetical protein
LFLRRRAELRSSFYDYFAEIMSSYAPKGNISIVLGRNRDCNHNLTYVAALDPSLDFMKS